MNIHIEEAGKKRHYKRCKLCGLDIRVYKPSARIPEHDCIDLDFDREAENLRRVRLDFERHLADCGMYATNGILYR